MTIDPNAPHFCQEDSQNPGHCIHCHELMPVKAIDHFCQEDSQNPGHCIHCHQPMPA